MQVPRPRSVPRPFMLESLEPRVLLSAASINLDYGFEGSKAADTQVVSNNTRQSWPGSETVRVGRGSSNNDTASVMVFKLPEAGELQAGESITAANLDVQLLGGLIHPGVVFTTNIDVHGLGSSTSPLVQSTHYTATGTLIQDDFAVAPASGSGISPASLATNASGDTGLLSYISSQYDNGNGAGKYVFIRLSPDASPPSTLYNNHYYTLATGDHATAANRPVLTLEISSSQNDPPGNLSAIAASGTQVDLTWNDNSDDENGFHIYRSDDGGNDFDFVAYVSKNSTGYSDAGPGAQTPAVQAGQTYLYKIKASGIADTSFSSTASVTTPGGTGTGTRNIDLIHGLTGNKDADRDVAGDATYDAWVGKTEGRVGWGRTQNAATILSFKLPDDLASGESITAANLNVELLSIDNHAGSGGLTDDLTIHGLGRQNSSTVLTSHFAEAGTLIQNNFATATTSAGTLSSTSAGDTNLLNYLNAKYDGGNGAGKYVFLRLSAKGVNSSANYHNFYKIGTGDTPASASRPVLSLEITGNGGGPSSDVGAPSGDNSYFWVDDVSTSGTGTYASPFNTIAAAIAAYNSNASGKKGVALRGGTYHESVKNLPGGTAGQDFIFAGEAGQKAIISGFGDITGWQSQGSGLYKATLGWEPRSFFFDGSRQALSHEPNEGWNEIEAGNVSAGYTWNYTAADQANNYTGNGKVVDITDAALTSGNVGNLVGTFIQVFKKSGNVINAGRILKHTGTTITVGALNPKSGKADFILTVGSGSPGGFILKGSTDTLVLDKVGEWATLKNTSGNFDVWYRPGAGVSAADLNAKARAPELNDLIKTGKGSDHITLDNLEVIGSQGIGISVLGTVSGGSVTDWAKDIAIQNTLVHSNEGMGISVFNADGVVVNRNVVMSNGRSGILLAQSKNGLIDQNEVAYNLVDGILVGGKQGAENITVSNNYSHHHLMWGHPDNFQILGGGVDNVTMAENLSMFAAQGLMSQEVGGANTFNGNTFLGSGAYGVIFGHDDSLNWSFSNNTLGMNNFGPMNLTGEISAGQQHTGDHNLFLKKHVFDTRKYQGTDNLFWHLDPSKANDPSAHIAQYVDSSGATHKVDNTDQFLAGIETGATEQDPGFGRAPVGYAVIETREDLFASTRTQLIVHTEDAFSAGDHVEVNGDGVSRAIASVSSPNSEGAITITLQSADELPVIPQRVVLVANWGAATNFNYDMVPDAGSAAYGSQVNITQYKLGSFDGDNTRDLPAVSSDLLKAIPDPNRMVAPSYDSFVVNVFE